METIKLVIQELKQNSTSLLTDTLPLEKNVIKEFPLEVRIKILKDLKSESSLDDYNRMSFQFLS